MMNLISKVNILGRSQLGSQLNTITKRWATNLGGGSTQNGRDSAGRRLGIKLGNGASVKVPEVIVRQRGFQYYPGENIGVGKDHTLYALKQGTIKFERDYERHRTIVHIIPPPGPPPRSFLLKNLSSYVIN